MYQGRGFFSAVFYCMSVQGHDAVPKESSERNSSFETESSSVRPDEAQLVTLTGKY